MTKPEHPALIWKPVLDSGLTAVDEGKTYLFAVETNDGWEYFTDAIIWDAETDADWSSGSHGWSLADDIWFTEMPKPPEKMP